MKSILHVFGLAIVGLAVSSIPAFANARIVSVIPVGGACVSGPSGHSVQFWDVEAGRTYQITITNVTECGNGGTAPTINVRVNNTSGGNVDVVATLVSPGTYVFTYTVPLLSTCTGPIFYCTTPGSGNDGVFVQRSGSGDFQAHLRVSAFGPNCTNPTEVGGPACSNVRTSSRTWGAVKQIYR